MIKDEWIESGSELPTAIIPTQVTGFRCTVTADERTHMSELEDELRWMRELTL